MDTNRTTNEKIYSRTRISSAWGADIKTTHIIVGFRTFKKRLHAVLCAVRCSSFITGSSALREGVWVSPHTEPWTDWNFTGTTA